ncbi:MAG: hypothetical protein DHS20C20_01650 [Ardenticatenaceae bacterium]|nr:MAG: hypothetical protein DHS20C20_01650 [Ardenticatenaceae bacterium]
MKEVSIWVDQVYGLLGNSAFIRSVCADEFPSRKHHVDVRWAEPRNARSRKSRFRQDSLPLSHCTVQLSQKVFHLLALGEVAWKAFQEDHMLTDLDFQPKLAGIVIIIEKGHIERQFEWFENPEKIQRLPKATRLLSDRLGYLSFENNSPLSLGLWFLSWIKSQRLPFVIAATGYQTSNSSLEELRNELGLDLDTPLIPGPSLHYEKGLIFDSEHAKQVLSALNDYMEITRKPNAA